MTRWLIDQGNSRLKLASVVAGKIQMLNEYAEPAELCLPDESVTDIWVSSVANTEKSKDLRRVLDKGVAVQHWVAVEKFALRQPTRYAKDQLGVDRWLAVLACRSRYDGPCLVVDSGTATTIDLVDETGVHLGGYILPGFQLMEDALLEGTAIPMKSFVASSDAVATDTVSAIRLGAPRAVAALVESLYHRQANTRLFLGGGGAKKLADELAISYTQVEQLVLDGLARLADMESV